LKRLSWIDSDSESAQKGYIETPARSAKMSYHDLMQAAQNIANTSPFSASYVREWNALEDILLGKLDLLEVEAVRVKARTDRDVMAAGVLLTMLGE
jgi:hypothetical protein